MPVAEVSRPTHECPAPELWQCYDQHSAEVEVLEFMYSLVRAVKPALMIETGSFRGLSATYIGKALRDNGRGKLITCEVDPKPYDVAKELLTKSRLIEYVDCRLISSLELEVPGPIDILFLDSLPNLRMAELDKFSPHMSPMGVIVIHDCNTGFHNDLRQQILQRDKSRELSVVFLPTPRGLAICQKRQGRE